MIKIQLCPREELESQYWWAFDVGVGIAALFAAYIGVQYYLGTIQERIDSVDEKAASLVESTKRLQPDLERFKMLDKDIKALNVKLDALKKITVSKISRYKPVIVVEHFQNLKPEGVWFKSFKVGAAGNKDEFELRGQAFDNLLVAEMMTAMRATETQEKDDGDLRTQVRFAELMIEETQIGREGGGGGSFPELATYPEFRIKGKFADHGGKDAVGPFGEGAESGEGSGSGTSGAEPGDRPKPKDPGPMATRGATKDAETF